MFTKIIMPPLGDTTDEARIVKWEKKEGDALKKGDKLFEVETDKTTLDVEALSSGVLGEIVVHDDQIARVGDVVGWIIEE
ncbi:MAG TPA: lipoyl domain-containing protein [Anaerolineae bacterium]